LTPCSGLGAGIAVSSFARQKIDTTVIEIDPAVYNASRQYFGLPDLGSERVFIRDARAVIAEKRLAALQHGTPDVAKYDYVVHDCFSGGGVPAHLFTVEFWEDLKVIMNPEGVVAVVSRSTHRVRPFLVADWFPTSSELRREGRLASRESNPFHIAKELWPVSRAPRPSPRPT
jgi:spermidine synthase